MGVAFHTGSINTAMAAETRGWRSTPVPSIQQWRQRPGGGVPHRVHQYSNGGRDPGEAFHTGSINTAIAAETRGWRSTPGPSIQQWRQRPGGGFPHRVHQYSNGGRDPGVAFHTGSINTAMAAETRGWLS